MYDQILKIPYRKDASGSRSLMVSCAIHLSPTRLMLYNNDRHFVPSVAIFQSENIFSRGQLEVYLSED